jgi:hypothetical protein
MNSVVAHEVGHTICFWHYGIKSKAEFFADGTAQVTPEPHYLNAEAQLVVDVAGACAHRPRAGHWETAMNHVALHEAGHSTAYCFYGIESYAQLCADGTGACTPASNCPLVGRRVICSVAGVVAEFLYGNHVVPLHCSVHGDAKHICRMLHVDESEAGRYACMIALLIEGTEVLFIPPPEHVSLLRAAIIVASDILRKNEEHLKHVAATLEACGEFKSEHMPEEHCRKLHSSSELFKDGKYVGLPKGGGHNEV